MLVADILVLQKKKKERETKEKFERRALRIGQRKLRGENVKTVTDSLFSLSQTFQTMKAKVCALAFVF